MILRAWTYSHSAYFTAPERKGLRTASIPEDVHVGWRQSHKGNVDWQSDERGRRVGDHSNEG